MGCDMERVDGVMISIDYLNDKKVDYKLLSLFSYFEKKDELGSYINYDDIYEISNMYNLKKKSIDEKIRNLESKNIVNRKHKEYKIYYNTNNGIYIEKNVLKFLIENTDSNSIKIYCLLMSILENNYECLLTRDFICEQIGLSKNSKKNLNLVGKILKNFCNNNFFKRRKETIVVENNIVKTVYYYQSISYNKYIFNPFKNEVNKNNIIQKKEKKQIQKGNPHIFYIIYEITDLTNGMKYIGKHKTDDLNDGYMGSGRLLKQNQELKGIENFTKKILHLCKNEQHMDEMERLEIEKVKAYENNMYYNLI